MSDYHCLQCIGNEAVLKMLYVLGCFKEVLCSFANVTLHMRIYRSFTTRGIGIILQVFSLAASWAAVIIAVQMKVNHLTFTFSVSAESF